MSIETTHPAAIARAGLGLPPGSGPKAEKPFTCMTCGRTVPEGGTRVRWKPGASFTDWQYLASDSNAVCGDCSAFLGAVTLRNCAYMVANRRGAWKLTRDEHLVWLLTDPPAPPFVTVFAESQQQHLVWRAAPTLDANLMHIQYGRRSLRIDRPALFDASEKARRAAEIARENGCRVTPRHPFTRLDRKLTDLSHGVIRGDILGLAEENGELSALLDELMQLDEGVLWGLSILNKSKIENPLAEPLHIENGGKK